MFLYDVFPAELIEIDLEADDKDEAFEDLVDKFCQVRNSNKREEILQALWDRESKMSTGIQKGIAIPHGKTDCVEDVCGILGISKRGIDYESLDGQPVFLVFMLLAPLTDSEDQLRVLKRLVELFHNKEFYADLLAQKDPQSANRILKKYEDIYIASE